MPSSFPKNLTLFFFLLLISILLLVFDRLTFLNWLKGGSEKLFNPTKEQISRNLSIFFVKKNPDLDPIIFQAKIDHLTAENAQLQTLLDSLDEENQSLRKELNVPQKTSSGLLPAKNLSIIDGLMTLDKGLDDEVKEGQVVTSEGILVGRIVSVTPFASRVILPLKEGNKVKVKVLPSKEKGVLVGTPEGRIILDEVLQKVELEPDQVIVTTGEEGKYPADLPVGKIDEVIKDDVQIYKQAEVKPLVDYATLKVVMIRF